MRQRRFLPLLQPMMLDDRLLDLQEAGWAYEIRFDGYRLMAEFGEGRCVLTIRNGTSASRWFPELYRVLADKVRFPGGPYVVDGEVCVFNGRGLSDFDRVHARVMRRKWFPGADPVTFCVFDLIVDRGLVMTHSPYRARKARLDALLKPKVPSLMYVNHFECDSELSFKSVGLPPELEGLVAKREDSFYQPGVRSTDWAKVERTDAVPSEQVRGSVGVAETG